MSQLVQLRRAPGSTSRAAPARETDPDPGVPAVYMETFGCQMNEADTALILGQLGRRGYRRVRDPEKADVILINTCAVREKAEDRVYGRTSQLLQHRKKNPGLVIGITGCMAEHLREQVTSRAPHIALVAGPDAYRGIAELVDRARSGEPAVDVHLNRHEVYEGLDGDAQDDGVCGQITIQRGCDKFCTFCVVPFTRGRERGVPPREVLRQARRLAAAGYREVTLLGQTVNSYGYEDVEFADLLHSVASIEGLSRIRFTSPYPVDFSDRLIDTMAELPGVVPYVHLPVQSGSDRMLSAMKRGYDRTQFLDLVRKLRSRIQGITLSTDIMVGFCGETEEDHTQTLRLMEDVHFDSAFMFRYSDRGITHASKHMEDDVLDPVKGRRLREVIELQEQHTRAAHASLVGTDVEVLVVGTSKRGDKMVGRSRGFHNVLLPLAAGTAGETLHARVTATTGHSLLATPTP